MGYKIKYVLKKSKPVFITIILLWIALSIVFVAPASISIVDAQVDGKINFDKFTDVFIKRLGSIIPNIQDIFKEEYIKTFAKGEGYLVIVLLIVAAIGSIKMLPKNEYTDIEHGSSDWAEKGEQYKILSPNKGILLAEKNYLPVDKRGNVNVLVVGRFRFW